LANAHANVILRGGPLRKAHDEAKNLQPHPAPKQLPTPRWRSGWQRGTRVILGGVHQL